LRKDVFRKKGKKKKLQSNRGEPRGVVNKGGGLTAKFGKTSG